MLFLKLVQSLVKALNSEGTPGQVAAGMVLGALLGLSPLVNLHNLAAFSAAVLLNVSFPGFMLGWAACIPAGFALDPLFDAVGTRLLVETPALSSWWTALYNVPVVPLTNFNNTVVLGSVVTWAVAAIPLYVLLRWGVGRYRERVFERLVQTRAFQLVKASKAYNVYRLFRP